MQNAPREHSAILSTFSKLPFSIKTFFCLFLSGRLRQVLLYRQYYMSITVNSDLSRGFIFSKRSHKWSFMKIKPSRIGGFTLSFTDKGKHANVVNFNVNICLLTLLAKIKFYQKSEFIVLNNNNLILDLSSTSFPRRLSILLHLWHSYRSARAFYNTKNVCTTE